MIILIGVLSQNLTGPKDRDQEAQAFIAMNGEYDHSHIFVHNDTETNGREGTTLSAGQKPFVFFFYISGTFHDSIQHCE